MMEEMLKGLYASWAIVAAIFSGSGFLAWQLHTWDKRHEDRHKTAENRLASLEIHSHHDHKRKSDSATSTHYRLEQEDIE